MTGAAVVAGPVICTGCRRRPAVAGYSTCAPCQDRTKDWRAFVAEHGLCGKCGHEREDADRKLCRQCRQGTRERSAANVARGFCRCGHPRDDPDRSKCSRCRASTRRAVMRFHGREAPPAPARPAGGGRLPIGPVEPPPPPPPPPLCICGEVAIEGRRTCARHSAMGDRIKAARAG